MTDFSRVGEATARSPLGRHLDWHVVSMAPDGAVLRMPFAKHNVTVGNMVHGGAIAALADAAATAACWATDASGEGSRGATIALHVNYLKAALGCELVATAKVVHRGGTVCVVEVGVADDKGDAVARATVTYKLTHQRA